MDYPATIVLFVLWWVTAIATMLYAIYLNRTKGNGF